MSKRACGLCGGNVTKKGNGLGTWKCENGCRDRQVKIERFIGCGKETERNRMEIVTVRRHIPVVYA